MERRLAEWPKEVNLQAMQHFDERGGLLEVGDDTLAMFCKPTDEQLARLRTGQEPDPREDYFSGRNVFVLLIWGKGVEKMRQVYDALLERVGEGGVVAKHHGEDYREWHPSRVRRTRCRGPQQSQH